MVLELHVWGPAFSLPSIDPQCLAAIAYLTQAVTRDEWVLVASSDIALSPTKELPALKDGLTAVGGFLNIIGYLRQKSNGQWDLDSHFSDSKDQADITAFSSHVLTNATPLLDLSLYVSSQNYATATRPAYTSLLPWPAQYFVPPTHRSLAKARTEHLALSSLDLDTIDEEEQNRRKVADLIPDALRGTIGQSQTVTGLVKERHGGKRFRLDAMVEALCEPLIVLLGEKKWLLSEDRPSSLDCLALGYLSLALVPDVLMDWLKEGMKSKWPGLCRFVRRGVEECFGGTVGVENASLVEGNEGRKGEGKLPWRAPKLKGAKFAEKVIWNEMIDSVPFYRNTIITASSKKEPGLAAPTNPLPSVLLPTIITATTAIAAVASYLFYAGIGNEREDCRLSDMGEAGALFAGLDFGATEQETKAEIPKMRGNLPVGLEVDVAVDEKD